MHSIVVSNIPLAVSNVTVMKFLQLHGLVVEHIQAFPDDYHHVNEVAQTKSLQIFTPREEGKHLISDLLSQQLSTEKMLELEELPRRAGGSAGSSERGLLGGKRLSVTIL
ncbi:HCL519Wp [Eremothecium sinecaudum]|uniref:HCL519Wp n=1 Tax=Eremothecium sinecaudum TaxID=45286 RepID=A0A109UYF5_9SACH|nr:HCL519Wp [Eremothecium sinecaudum]AMD19632.1 HCL519Wp [Eremothecium sinecaudum]